MTPKQIMDHGLSEGEDCFAVATIVRTAGTTSAKPGAKALLREDGKILQGWLGGGCVRGAIKEATLRAYATGQPQFISVAPQEELTAWRWIVLATFTALGPARFGSGPRLAHCWTRSFVQPSPSIARLVIPTCDHSTSLLQVDCIGKE